MGWTDRQNERRLLLNCVKEKYLAEIWVEMRFREKILWIVVIALILDCRNTCLGEWIGPIVSEIRWVIGRISELLITI